MRGRGPPALGRRDEVLAPARDQTARALREARRSGVLSLPARNLTAFPTEAYHLDEYMDKDEKKWECVDLVKVDLSHNAIPSLADDIGGLVTLTSVKLAQNKLTSLPDGFFELTALTYLDLSHNQLCGPLSEAFGSLTSLKELALTSNKLQTLPASLSRLASLETLRIEENALAQLPSEIGQLTRLHTLMAHTNQLTALPPSFGRLRSLLTLDLKKNRLESMGEQLASLPSLKFLDLRQNKLTVFPQLPQGAELDQVFLGFNVLSMIDEASILRAQDSITVLDLRDNKLSVLPVNLACLYKLKTLDVANNDLSDLPPGLGYLKHLNHLLVDGNPLRAIRRGVASGGCEALKKYLRTRGAPPANAQHVMAQEIDELQLLREREQAVKAAASSASSGRPGTASLSSAVRSSIDFTSSGVHVYRDAAASGSLDLSDHVLQVVPHELCGSPTHNFAGTLLHLTLSKNHLTTLPRELGELQALMSLTVEENQLRSLDAVVATLPRLALLRLRKNQLTSDAIDAFLHNAAASRGLAVSLKEIDLRNNLLTGMPRNIRFLPALETLQLALNKLETLDGFPWHELARVSVVSVSDNKLRSLGSIYHLPRLASLSCENNNLTSVPCELGLCPFLTAIYMNGNPQKTVRGAILAKGSLAILTYLKNKLPPNASLPSTTGATATVAAIVPKPMAAQLPRRKNLSMYAATAGDDDDPNEPERSSGGKQDSLLSALADDRDPATLDAQIAQLEAQLESLAVSAAKRFALKKELALARSAKLRGERRLASRT